jgi:presenilin-like A22 family membrane protease
MSLEPTPVIVLLLILAAYDAISVYETGHMVSLADSITKMKLPLLFIIPYTRDFSISSINEMRDKAILMGVGDVVIPNLLVVSSQVFSNSSYIGFLKISALFTLLGGVLGLLLLITLMKKRTIHAGLPLLNFGAISGYLLSSLF